MARTMVVGIGLLAALLAGCGGGDSPEKEDPCKSSICGTSGSGGSGGGGALPGNGGTPGTGGGGGGSGSGGTPIGPPANLDLDFYKCKVEPIVDRSCSMLGCHGTETGRPYRIYARGRLRNNQMVPQVSTCLEPGTPMNLQEEGTGTVMCLGWSKHTDEEWQKNYDNARAFMTDGMNPDDSELLRQATKGSGLPHAGVQPFTKGDAEYNVIRAWLAGEKLGTTCDTGPN